MPQPDVSYELQAPAPAKPVLSSPSARLASRVSAKSVGLIVPAALLLLWKVAADRGWAPPQFLPPPSIVLRTFGEQYESGELFTNFAISLGRVAGGFGIGALLGVVLGIVMGLSRTLEDYLSPLFRAASQVPVLGWLPLAMMFLGIGESLKLVIIAHASLVPVALNTLKGIQSVPRQYIEVARAFGFSHGQLLRKVIFPASVPSMFVGIRYGVTQAWLSLVTVELLASSEGLGFMIVWGRQLLQLDLVLAAIVVIGAVGLTFDKGLALLEQRLLRWRPKNSLQGGHS
jgi:sulfonate transport system permease protein